LTRGPHAVRKFDSPSDHGIDELFAYTSGSQTEGKLPPGVICDSSMGNAEPKSQCYLVLWVITAKEIFDLKYEKFLLRTIRQNRYLDLGNGSNKFGNHWCVHYVNEM